MVHEAVAQRYAAALFALALEKGQAQKMQEELRAVDKEMRDHPALSRALHAPNVPLAVKKNIAKKLFGHHSAPLLNFLYILIDKKRDEYVTEILRQYRNLLDTASGVVKAKVETAVELPPALKAHLVDVLSKQEKQVVQVTWSVNADLLGGYVVRIGDRLLDSSFRSQLVGLERKLAR